MNAGFRLRRWTRALVVGAGRSGIAAAHLLASAGIELHIYDRRESLGDLAPSQAKLFLGSDHACDEAFAGIDLLVLSPGIDPRDYRRRVALLAPKAEIHGELGLGLFVLTQTMPAIGGRACGQLPIALITGTNGKSTVTAMLGEVLDRAHLAPFTGGNLGTPLCERVLEAIQGLAPWPSSLVVECSSYQLETLPARPNAPVTAVAMVLNLTPDHLARYDSLQHYAATKSRIFSGLDANGLALLDAKDAFTPQMQAAVPRAAKVVRIEDDTGPRVLANQLDLGNGETIARSLLRVVGAHNAKNALFCAIAARHLGASLEQCREGLAAFQGLPHRMRPVGESGGVAFYNDSKATNVASVIASLGSFDRPFVLIAGGQAKGDDLEPLRALLATQGRGLVAIGESAPFFLALVPPHLARASAHDMRQAVALAQSMASPGDAVVLSPACASWDMYSSYAERGNAFEEAVRAFAPPCSSH